MVAAEFLTGLGALKTAFDMTKALQNVHDTVTHDRTVIELQKEILAAQQAQSALVERVSDLEKEVASFEKWDAEKEKYELKATGSGGFVMVLKPTVRGTATPHWLCPNCYEQRKKSYFIKIAHAGGHYLCTPCKTAFIYHGLPKWLD